MPMLGATFGVPFGLSDHTSDITTSIAAVALGASIVGNSLWNTASRKLPLTLSGQVIVSETVFALLYGFAYEMRWPHGLEVLATILLVSGVWPGRAVPHLAAHSSLRTRGSSTK
jgi:drug/metabolite transporter (DMT)-like permease